MAMDNEDIAAIKILSIPPRERTSSDNARLYAYLRAIECLPISGASHAHRDTELRSICLIAHYRRVPDNMELYHAGDLCDSWYILLAGSVLIDSSMFLPRACFGMRINGGAFRQSDCLVLEPSDLIVIDYTDRGAFSPSVFTNTHRQAVTSGLPGRRRLDDPGSGSYSSSSTPDATSTISALTPSPSIGQSLARSSQLSSDNSSALSVSSTGGGARCSLASSIAPNGTDSGRGSSYRTSTGSEPRKDRGFTRGGGGGGVTVVGGGDSSQLDSDDDEELDADEEDEDEDEEDLESSSHESLRDAFWECMLKEPPDRTEDDIEVLMENVQQLPAFSNLTKATCRALCAVMVVAMVHEAGQIVLGDNEPLDTWSVVLNGTVEVVHPDGTIRELTRGDAFGVRCSSTRADDRIHRGVMRTVTEDCQFACVPQADYSRIMSREGDAEIPEMGEGGRVVLVYEELEPLPTEPQGTKLSLEGVKAGAPSSGAMVRRNRVVTKGTPEKLIEHLIADQSNVDITYTEDFLLTYRTFLDNPRPIVDRLLTWHMHNASLRVRVNRILLLWVHNHFNDFDGSVEMMKFVEQFDQILTSDGTAGERRLFQLACSTKARPRQVDLELPLHYGRRLSERSALNGTSLTGTTAASVQIPFTLVGGHEGFGVFVDQIHAPYALDAHYWCTSSKRSSSPANAQSAIVKHAVPCIRRADQLLYVNGRSVEHCTPAEVLQLIHSLVSASETDHREPHATDGGTSSVCTVCLLVIYNPVQYYQLISTLDGRIANASSVNQYRSVVGRQSHGPNDFPLQNVVNGMGGRKAGLPTSHSFGPSRQPTSPSRLTDGVTVSGRADLVSTNPPEPQHLSSSPLMDGDAVGETGRSRSAHSSPIRGGQEQAERRPCSGQRINKRSRENSPSQWSRNVNTRTSLATPRTSVGGSERQISATSLMPRSSSQPDLTTVGLYPPVSDWRRRLVFGHGDVHSTGCGMGGGPGGQECCIIIRVWRSNDSSGKDQSNKLVPLPGQQTNAIEATRLAAEEFGLPEDEWDSFGLYHVTVEPGPLVKQSRLANTVDDLAGRMTLNARYYLKHHRNHDALVSDEVAKTILSESRVSFMQLNPEDLAVRITLDDYTVFRSVQFTEYVDEVFSLTAVRINGGGFPTNTQQTDPSTVSTTSGCDGYATGHDNLDRFTDLVNREAYWAPTEICQESNLTRRVELLKRFIKLTKLCRQLRNFNSMFCLLVGLHQTPVERLKQTWERLPNKYQKMYRELSMVLDTSRNFYQYRNLLTHADASAPMLPYLPLMLKDLTFIHLGNPSRTPDGLVNFVKLRMLAKEIRAIGRMCNVDYDLQAAQRLLRHGTTTVASRTRAWATSNSSAATKATALPTTSGAASSNVAAKNANSTNVLNGWEMASGGSQLIPGEGSGKRLSADGAIEEDGRNSILANRNALAYFGFPKLRGYGSLNPDCVYRRTSLWTYAYPASAPSKRPSTTTALGRPVPSANTGHLQLGIPPGGPAAVTGGPRRRSTAFGFTSGLSSSGAKKLYETWLVQLRIRTYLANLCVNRDPGSLSQWSVRLEPGSRDSKMSSINNSGNSSSVNTSGGTSTSSFVSANGAGTTNGAASTGSSPISKDLKSPTKVPTSTAKQSTPREKPIPTSTHPPTTTDSNSPSTTPQKPLMRPILGAQSEEDVRRLLAQTHRRSHHLHHRLPAIMFPPNATAASHSSSHNNNPNAPQFILLAQPQASSSNAGLGFGPFQYHQQHHHQRPPPSTTSAAAAAAMHASRAVAATAGLYTPSQRFAQHPPPTSYTMIGSKTMLLDSLIPMAQRIGPARTNGGGGVFGPSMMRFGVNGTPTAVVSTSTGPMLQHIPTHMHPPHAKCAGTGRTPGGCSHSPSPQVPQLRIPNNASPKASTDPTGGNNSRGGPHHPQSMAPTGNDQRQLVYLRQSSNPAAAPIPQHPPSTRQGQMLAKTSNSPTTGTCVPGLDSGKVNGGTRVVVSQSAAMRLPPQSGGDQQVYHYPTAGLVIANPSYRQQPTPPVTNARFNQMMFERKPHRPPPYELALALQQEQQFKHHQQQQQQQQQQQLHQSGQRNEARHLSSIRADESHRPGHCQPIAGRHIQPTATRPSVDPTTPQNVLSRLTQTRHASVEFERHGSPRPSGGYHPPGGPPRPGMNDGEGAKMTLSSSTARAQQQRPAPPPYHQVVGVTRYNQQQQIQQNPQVDNCSPSNPVISAIRPSSGGGPGGNANERPLPPSRTLAVLSKPNATPTTRSPSACPAVTASRSMDNGTHNNPRSGRVGAFDGIGCSSYGRSASDFANLISRSLRDI